ncbi:hypothetical protein M2103_001988 [Ereboglobus sp. PH5-5]|uniref:GldG family protein n=1 Tax=unclassified Ereboglobus TaxID=2626932 RepID=UPI002404EAEF|nr:MULTISPECIES: GldG family protein [unclassified Ereboglobus]MDF9827278.1 hypothetical protein [Ereboglobus sp. PH5-10]MDF9833755.1 hypothetical protein [Ereboglobus sp. PH5-5]
MKFFESFRATRWLRSTNLVLQALLFVAFFGGLNYLALQYSWRFDITQLRKHTLSAETRAYLTQLDQPIRVVVTLPKSASPDDHEAPADLDQINNDVAGLLREYTYALETNAKVDFRVDYIDVYQRPREAEQLGLEPNAIYFFSGQRPRKVGVDALYRYKNNQRVAFLGEQAFTAAILGVSNPEQKKIYFLTGHGEMDPHSVDNQRGLSEIRNALTARNYALDALDLSRARAIPDDAALIISVGAQYSYEAREQEMLRQYMGTRAGRLMLFTAPGTDPTGLEDLLREWGIVADNNWIYDRSTSSQSDMSGDLILTTDTQHPITQALADNNLALKFGATRSVRPAPSRATDPSLSITPLVLTAPTAWGEVSYRTMRRGRAPRYDVGADLPGPLAVVTVAERVTAKSDLPFSIPVGRLAVFGCSDFIANGRLGTRANSTVFFSTLNWITDSDTQFNIPARPIERFQLALSRDRLSRLRYILLFGAPGAFAILGFIVYWTRRR